MATVLTAADERKLVGVAAPLVAVVRRVALTYSGRFIVVEGLRSKARQKELFRVGKSRTLNSKHLVGRAVDVAPLLGKSVSWNWDDFTPLVEAAKACASQLGVPMNFGYDWGWDAPHWELEDDVGRK